MWKASIAVNHSDGVIELRDKDLAEDLIACTESTQAGEDFTVGGTVASTISFTIFNEMIPDPDKILTPYGRKQKKLKSDTRMVPRYPDIQWMGARITPKVGLELSDPKEITYGDLVEYKYGNLDKMLVP